eukprot:403353096
MSPPIKPYTKIQLKSPSKSNLKASNTLSQQTLPFGSIQLQNQTIQMSGDLKQSTNQTPIASNIQTPLQSLNSPQNQFNQQTPTSSHTLSNNQSPSKKLSEEEKQELIQKLEECMKTVEYYEENQNLHNNHKHEEILVKCCTICGGMLMNGREYAYHIKYNNDHKQRYEKLMEPLFQEIDQVREYLDVRMTALQVLQQEAILKIYNQEQGLGQCIQKTDESSIQQIQQDKVMDLEQPTNIDFTAFYLSKIETSPQNTCQTQGGLADAMILDTQPSSIVSQITLPQHQIITPIQPEKRNTKIQIFTGLSQSTDFINPVPFIQTQKQKTQQKQIQSQLNPKKFKKDVKPQLQSKFIYSSKISVPNDQTPQKSVLQISKVQTTNTQNLSQIAGNSQQSLLKNPNSMQQLQYFGQSFIITKHEENRPLGYQQDIMNQQKIDQDNDFLAQQRLLLLPFGQQQVSSQQTPSLYGQHKQLVADQLLQQQVSQL